MLEPSSLLASSPAPAGEHGDKGGGVGRQRQRWVRWYSPCALNVMDSNTGDEWRWLNVSSPKLECQIWNSFLPVESHRGVVSSGKAGSGTLQRSICPQIYWVLLLMETIISQLLAACSSLSRKYCAEGQVLWESGYTLNLPARVELDMTNY